MGMPALRFEEGYSVEERVARLEAHVEHIQSDISDMKIDMREMRQDIRRLDSKMDAGFQRMDSKFDEIKKDSKSDLKWIMGIFGAGVLFLAGFMYFLVDRPLPAFQPKTKDDSVISTPASVPGGRTSGQASPQ